MLSRPSLSGFISNLTIQRQHFPTDEDQTGAAKALLRLQDTYRLDANTISTGDLPGKGLKSMHTTSTWHMKSHSKQRAMWGLRIFLGFCVIFSIKEMVFLYANVPFDVPLYPLHTRSETQEPYDSGGLL